MKWFLLLMTLAGLLANYVLRSHTPVEAAPVLPGVDAATEQQILAVTVQMAMYEVPDAQGVEAGGRGLGTLVRSGASMLLVTHDHWTHLNANLNEVEFRDAYGTLLLTLSGPAFNGLIRYRDGGTLVLVAPSELLARAGTVATLAMPAFNVASGSTIWVARRSPATGGATVEVVSARVEKAETVGEPRRLHLRAGDGIVIVPGDSGGGVWADWQFLGNVWAGGMEITTPWYDRFTGGQQETETSLIIAALFPQQDAKGEHAESHATGEFVALEQKLLGQ